MNVPKEAEKNPPRQRGRSDAEKAEAAAERIQQRAALLERLEKEGREDLAQSLRKCGLPVVLKCATCEWQRLEAETSCKRKWCPVCAWRLAAKRGERLRQVVRTFRWPLFVTLTMKNVDDLSLGAVRDLRRAFGRFRRHKFFARCKGGVAAMEVTNAGNGWHPHLHCVLDCDWLGWERTRPLAWEGKAEKREAYMQAKRDLEAAWAKALRQEMGVCHAKRTNDVDIVTEVVKYAVKGTDLLACETEIGPLIDAITGTRMLTTFGSAFRFPFIEEDRERCGCETCGEPGHWMPEEIAEGRAAKRREATENAARARQRAENKKRGRELRQKTKAWRKAGA